MLNAATFERFTDRREPSAVPGGRTAVNCPPTYMTPLPKAIARTTPFVCHDRFGASAAAACPGAAARTAVATAPITHARSTAAS